jgi:hypothetical protein
MGRPLANAKPLGTDVSSSPSANTFVKRACPSSPEHSGHGLRHSGCRLEEALRSTMLVRSTVGVHWAGATAITRSHRYDPATDSEHPTRAPGPTRLPGRNARRTSWPSKPKRLASVAEMSSPLPKSAKQSHDSDHRDPYLGAIERLGDQPTDWEHARRLTAA